MLLAIQIATTSVTSRGIHQRIVRYLQVVREEVGTTSIQLPVTNAYVGLAIHWNCKALYTTVEVQVINY